MFQAPAKYHDDVITIYSTCIEYVYDLFILLQPLLGWWFLDVSVLILYAIVC